MTKFCVLLLQTFELYDVERVYGLYQVCRLLILRCVRYMYLQVKCKHAPLPYCGLKGQNVDSGRKQNQNTPSCHCCFVVIFLSLVKSLTLLLMALLIGFPYFEKLVEGLTFLHNDAKILQASLAPEMIVITKNGQWKIAGLFFSSTPVVIDGQVSFITIFFRVSTFNTC